MSGGYSMKHIGVSIIVTLAVLVLVSPLLRPKGAEAPSRTVTPEMREISREYREAMARRAAETAGQYKAGVVPIDALWTVQMKADLAALDDFALGLPPGRDGVVTRAEVAAFYAGRIHEYYAVQFAVGVVQEPVDSVEAFYRAKIELAQRLPSVRGNKAFLAARSEWEKKPTPDLLKKMFDAEVNQ